MSSGGRWLRSLCSLALVLFCAAVLHAQARAASAEPIVVDGLGRGTVPLGGQWQFHLGDDPAWASPTFDDSNWEKIDISRPWGDQGHWAYAGRAWYRRQIDFSDKTPGTLDVALYVPATSCAYEVYWNGRMIGRTDAMPLPTQINQSGAETFRLGKPERGVLAFRASTAPLDSTTSGDQLGLVAVPHIGTIEAIGNLAVTEHVTLLKRKLLTIAEILIYGQLSLFGALVWLRNRNQKLLFWMFAFLLSATLWVSLDQTLFPWLLNSPAAAAFYGSTTHSIEDVAFWFLLLYLLDLDRYPELLRWTRLLAWITLFSALADGLVFYMPNRDAHILMFEILDAVCTVGFSVPAIFPVVLIALAFRKRMDPARQFVAIAAFLSDMYFVVGHTAEQGERFTRWTLYNKMTRPLFTVDGVDVSVPAILSLLLVCAIVYAVYGHMVEQGQRQTALEQDYANAGAVQQVLIPEVAPAAPGFAIDSFYEPAGEVGGDFFQIIPLPGGGILTVIGDVSGKGMPAAMTVSLLIGTFRTLAHYTQSPGEIMAAMNQRMVGRSQGGFTTCLVLRADVDGTLTIANAGHIAPYLAGKELSLENGLPLGLVWSPAYAESTFHFPPDEQLTLLTDGVVEAREASGALFGFERTAALSVQPAEAIATAAQRFGQDDDITVLTLTRRRAGASSTTQHNAPILSPA
jgi:Stage II sporulation protein E (SpoIIE)